MHSRKVSVVHKYHITNSSSPGLNNFLGDNLHDGGWTEMPGNLSKDETLFCNMTQCIQ